VVVVIINNDESSML